jgi:hypothetical protein
MNKISLTLHFIERKKAEYDILVAQLESYDVGMQGE